LLFKRYKQLRFRDKFHIFFRIITVPWEHILKTFPISETLIDIGCGHGVLINLLVINNRNNKFIGIDYDKNKISISKQTENDMIAFYDKDLFEVKDYADTYSIFDVLYLIPYKKQERIIRHIFNRLPRNGYLIIKEESKEPAWKFIILYLQETFMVKLLHLTKGKGFYFRTEEDFKKLLSGIGFEVEIQHLHKGYLYPHILYICKK
jgi:2-polyprenyl-6-hydroxyphenyl methylase/3-demethylubiquinone-9 3-methyltransferase